MITDVILVTDAVVQLPKKLVTWFVVNVGCEMVGIWRRVNVDDFDEDIEAGAGNLYVDLIRQLEDRIPTWKVVPLLEVE